MPVDYAHEQLRLATYELAVRPGTIQERLLAAWDGHLRHLKTSAMPERDRWEGLRRRVTRYGSLPATILAMSDAEAEAVIEELSYFRSLTDPVRRP